MKKKRLLLIKDVSWVGYKAIDRLVMNVDLPIRREIAYNINPYDVDFLEDLMKLRHIHRFRKENVYMNVFGELRKQK